MDALGKEFQGNGKRWVAGFSQMGVEFGKFAVQGREALPEFSQRQEVSLVQVEQTLPPPAQMVLAQMEVGGVALFGLGAKRKPGIPNALGVGKQLA